MMNTDVSWLLVTRHRANLTRRRELHVARLDFSSVAHITQCRPPLPPRTARRFTRQAFPAPSACRVCPLAVHSAILYLLRRWLASSAGIRGEPAPPTSLPRGAAREEGCGFRSQQAGLLLLTQTVHSTASLHAPRLG